MREEKSDAKFIEWSLRIRKTNYDVQFLERWLKAREKRFLRGLDVGGGIGAFAKFVARSAGKKVRVTVVDPSRAAISARVASPKVEFQTLDFLKYESGKAYDFIIFKTVLHHIIGATERESLALQIAALAKAKSLLADGGRVFVEENFYEGLGGSDVTGRLIFWVTRRKAVAKLVRLLGANTAGEGVRFRSRRSWEEVFERAGLVVEAESCSKTWAGVMPRWQKIALLCSGRRQCILRLRVADPVGTDRAG